MLACEKAYVRSTLLPASASRAETNSCDFIVTSVRVLLSGKTNLYLMGKNKMSFLEIKGSFAVE
jgi:hypothetical protein